jgi:hypothetical protein
LSKAHTRWKTTSALEKAKVLLAREGITYARALHDMPNLPLRQVPLPGKAFRSDALRVLCSNGAIALGIVGVS